MVEIQINATGGDVAEQTSIQTGGGLTATDSLPVQDGVKQFSAHEREELTETEFSQDGQMIIPLSECEDPLHCEDPVMHISGTGHWFLEGWIGDHSVEFLVDSGSSVTAMSDILYKNLGAGRRTSGCTSDYSKDVAQRKWNRHRSIGVFALLGVVFGVANGVPHYHLQPGSRNGRDHWDRCVGIGVAAYTGH